MASMSTILFSPHTSLCFQSHGVSQDPRGIGSRVPEGNKVQVWAGDIVQW